MMGSGDPRATRSLVDRPSVYAGVFRMAACLSQPALKHTVSYSRLQGFNTRGVGSGACETPLGGAPRARARMGAAVRLAAEEAASPEWSARTDAERS